MFGPLGLMLAGPVAALVGTRAALIGCGTLAVQATVGALLSPGVRNLRAPAPAGDGRYEDDQAEPSRK